jgi:hypothetical protein
MQVLLSAGEKKPIAWLKQIARFLIIESDF